MATQTTVEKDKSIKYTYVDLACCMDVNQTTRKSRERERERGGERGGGGGGRERERGAGESEG